MPRLKTKVKGEKKVRKEINKMAKKYPQAAALGIYEEAMAIHTEAQRRVPVDTGRLRASGYVAPPIDTRGVTSEVGYGTEYAVIQHERREFRHTVGEAGFLKKAIDKRKQGYAGRLSRRISNNVSIGAGVKAPTEEAPTSPKEGLRKEGFD